MNEQDLYEADFWEYLEEVGKNGTMEEIIHVSVRELLAYCPDNKDTILGIMYAKVQRSITSRFNGYLLRLIHPDIDDDELDELEAELDCPYARNEQNPKMITFFKRLTAWRQKGNC